MQEEKKRVLEMLAEGKISAGDAERLLDKLEACGGKPTDGSVKNGAEPLTPGRKQHLRIQVERPGQDSVNIRIPLSLTRTGRWLALLPPRVSERLAQQGIDLNAFTGLQGEELAAAIEAANIEIERGNGKKVRIFCE
jgi:hypothetical protein